MCPKLSSVTVSIEYSITCLQNICAMKTPTTSCYGLLGTLTNVRTQNDNTPTQYGGAEKKFPPLSLFIKCRKLFLLQITPVIDEAM